MIFEAGDGLDPQGRYSAEFCRRVGLARSKARTIKNHGLEGLPHKTLGRGL